MPAPVTAWTAGTWPTAKSLVLALYSSDGTADNPNGIAFHAQRPVLLENYTATAALTTNTGGKQTVLSSAGPATVSQVVLDTAGYFGQSSDQPGGLGFYEFLAAIAGGAGDGITPGGWHLISHFAAFQHGSTRTSLSADLTGTAQPSVSGTRQAPSTVNDSCAFFLDLVNVGSTVTWQPAVTIADSASAGASPAVDTTDISGEACKFCAIWAAVSATVAGIAVFSPGGTYPWTAPNGVSSVGFAGGGAGGGGGAGNVSLGGVEFGGGGAGGGGFSSGALAVTPGNGYSVITGAGGAGGTAPGGSGAAGGSSLMAGDTGSVTAHGGSAGAGATTSANGAGGAGGTGTSSGTVGSPASFTGGAGAAGSTAKYGGGGASSAGTGQAGAAATTAAGAPAPPGGGPGGAGGTVAISIVQSKQATGTGSSLTVTMKSPFAAGNGVLVFVYGQDFASPPDPVVKLSDGTPVASQTTADVTANDNLQVGLYNVFGVAGNETGVSISCSGGGSDKLIIAEVYEVSGLGPSPTVDQSSSHTQGPSSPTVNYQSYSGSPPATTDAPDLWVAMTAGQQTSSFNVHNPSGGQGWNTDSPQYAHNGSGGRTVYGAMLTAWQVKTTTGTMQFSGLFSKGVTKGTLAVAYAASPATAGNAPVLPPGGGGGGGLGSSGGGGNGADGSVTLTWTGVSGSGYGTPALPAPYPGWSDAATVGTNSASTVDINSAAGITSVLNFLSNPPVFRASTIAGQSIPTTALTQVTTGLAATVDSYSGWNPGTSAYTVQRDGLYLVHGLAAFANSATGARRAAVTVNGTSYWGPASIGATTGTTNVAKTQVLGLHAGDVVSFACFQNKGTALALATTDQTRFLLCWLGEIGVPASLWTPPDITFRWATGTMGGTLGGPLGAQLQQHLGNDLGFLVNRPYLLAHQGTAQTGLTVGAFSTVVLDTVGGVVHAGDSGDNYSGWTAGASNLYTAQASGWYLEAGEFIAGPDSTTGATVTAAVLPSASGGAVPSHSPDYYQQLTTTPTAGIGGGGAVFGVRYLAAGETVTPQIRASSYAAPYATLAGSNNGGANMSHYELVWLSN